MRCMHVPKCCSMLSSSCTDPVTKSGDALILTTVGGRRTHGPVLSQQMQRAAAHSNWTCIPHEDHRRGAGLHVPFDTQDQDPIAAVQPPQPTGDAQLLPQGTCIKQSEIQTGCLWGLLHMPLWSILAILEPCGEGRSSGTIAADHARYDAGCNSEPAFQLMPQPRGALDSIRPVPVDVSEAKQGCHIMSVEAAGLNFRDVLNCPRRLPRRPRLVRFKFIVPPSSCCCS